MSSSPLMQGSDMQQNCQSFLRVFRLKDCLGVNGNVSPLRFYKPRAKTSEQNRIQEEEIRDFKSGVLVHWADKASVTDLLSISKTLCRPHHT